MYKLKLILRYLRRPVGLFPVLAGGLGTYALIVVVAVTSAEPRGHAAAVRRRRRLARADAGRGTLAVPRIIAIAGARAIAGALRPDLLAGKSY